MSHATIAAILAGAERSFGARTAVVEGEHALTYAELARRVRARARHWHALGLRPGERVAILDWNTGAFLEAYFAAAELGAILNPLNHRLAVPELREILADSGARLLLAGRAFAGPVADLRGTVEHVLWCEDEPPADAPAFPASAVRPDDVAQLYYTSGTTGRAKGVMLTHRNVCTHAEWAVRELALTAADRWGHFAPLFHLADAWATFAITQVGGVHVLAPRFEADDALARIEQHGITLTNLIPTMLKRLVECPRARTADVSSLRLVLSGGAPIAPVLVQQVLEVLGCEYAQTYGMTETSPYLTLGLLPEHLRQRAAEEVLRLRARTGRPFGGIELEVVDADDRRVPADDRTVGEIRVRGATVTPGYWNRPDETARALRGGWLYTGDLAVVDAHGLVNIVDRKKDVILTGGESVYSTEVEHALHAHPAVLEVAVFGRPDETWGESVNAAVVLKPGHAASAAELQQHCRARIAAYKTPRAIEFLDELPKTGSGKISKQALRARPVHADVLETPSERAARARMVEEQLRARGIADERVLAALGRVPRTRFVLPEDRSRAYEDCPLAIGHGQTISQPFIVGFMSAALELTGGERVLEVGAGCGYQTAILALLAREVFALELLPELAARAAATLAELGLARVHLRPGDGHQGWPAAAPFDAILVAAAPERVPPALCAQLAPGGRLVLPLGGKEQDLVRLRCTPAGLVEERLLAVRFVPMRGRA